MKDLNENTTEEILAISEIIARKLDNEELSDEDEKKLSDWIFFSRRNQSLYNRIKDSRNFNERNELIRQINTDKAWFRYRQKINIDHAHKLRVRWWQYAAAIFIPLLIVTLLYVTRQKEEVEPVQIVEQQITPGSKNAILVLGSGKTINLKKRDSLDIKEEDGTRIVKDDELLSYHQTSNDGDKKIPRNTLIVPRGGEYSLLLADGSKVYLNSMSKLVFPVNFSKGIREVFLEGEACFIVKRDHEKPFIVNVNGVKIEVLGTTFNINAYSDQEKIITTLVEGKVKINLTDSPGDEFELHPDDQAVFDVGQNKVHIGKVDADNYLQWINGVYTFSDQSLDDIMKTLSRWYDFNYWFEQQDMKDIKFSGGLNKYESIEPILEIMESTGKVKVAINGKNILFSKK